MALFVLLVLLQVCAAAMGQVVGLQPTPQAIYTWNASTNQWDKTATTNTANPAATTPEAFAFYAWNATLGQWVPCETGSACLMGGLTLQHNGVNLAKQNLLNFSDSTPAAPSGSTNVTFQTDVNGNLSGYVLSNGCTTADCVITDPTRDQIIVQPVNTQFSVQSKDATGSYEELQMLNNKLTIFNHQRFGELHMDEFFGPNSAAMMGGPTDEGVMAIGETSVFNPNFGIADIEDQGVLLGSNIFAWTGCYTPQLNAQCQLNGGANGPYYFLDATSGDLARTLPPVVVPWRAITTNYGDSIQITACKVDASANTITVTPEVGDTIENFPSGYTLADQWQCVTFSGDGLHEWFVSQQFNGNTIFPDSLQVGTSPFATGGGSTTGLTTIDPLLGPLAPAYRMPTLYAPTGVQYSVRYSDGGDGTNDTAQFGYNLSNHLYAPQSLSEPQLYWGFESNWTGTSSYLNIPTQEAYLRYIPAGVTGGEGFYEPFGSHFSRLTGAPGILDTYVNGERVLVRDGSSSPPRVNTEFEYNDIIDSATYTGGITAAGTTGQTCELTAFNGGGSGATALVALTGTNTIASGTTIYFANGGSGFTSDPTSATAGNGTASCSGTATLSSLLGAGDIFHVPATFSDSMNVTGGYGAPIKGFAVNSLQIGCAGGGGNACSLAFGDGSGWLLRFGYVNQSTGAFVSTASLEDDGVFSAVRVNASLNGTLGATTPNALFATTGHFSSSIQSGVSGTTAGCMEMYASDSTTTLVYGTVASTGTMNWTSTKPANCE